MIFSFPSSRSSISDELLSAYIDSELTPADRARVEAALQAQPALRRRLAELQMTVDLMAQMEPMPVPRAFVLSEAQVQPHRERRRITLWQRLLPAATAVAAIALALVLGLDFGGVVAPASQPQIAFAPAVVEEAPASSTEAEVEGLRTEDMAAPMAASPSEPMVMKEVEVEKKVELTKEVAAMGITRAQETAVITSEPTPTLAPRPTSAPQPSPTFTPRPTPVPQPAPRSPTKPLRWLEGLLAVLVGVLAWATWRSRRIH